MTIIRYLSTLAIFFSAFNNYAAEQKLVKTRTYSQMEPEDVEGNEHEKKQKTDHSPIIFPSLDNKQYKVDYDIAIQSNLLQRTLANNQIIAAYVHSDILGPLVTAMALIYEYKARKTPKELYELVQRNLFNKYNVEQLSYFFYAARVLEFELLENVFADRFAQLINPSNVEEFMSSIQPEHAYLIEKFYYLRSAELYPKCQNLLIYNSQKLRKAFQIDSTERLQIIHDEFFTQMNLSINDLLDYQKNIHINEQGTLDLSNLFLSNINGLKRITSMGCVINLLLNDNLLTDLGDNLHSLEDLDVLQLNNNFLTDLGNSFYGLNISSLSLAYNQITELDDSLDPLQELKFLDLDNNLISILSDNLIKLRKLNVLYIQNNKLNNIVYQLPKSIKEISIIGNPVVPEDIAKLQEREIEYEI
ncbi:MAG: hypothetical protein P4L22_03115 [Candidatus Babeliales bacterium]|nr:hypothetical protein [Candidatus Babeliales bacterium]